MNRITNTDKWKDEWFLALSPFSKLVFMFLCDNCNEAGFYDLNSKFMQSQLKIPAKNIVASIKEIGKKVTFNQSGKKIWVDNFLFYQKQLPLDMSNAEHKKIKLMLEKNLEDFNADAGIMFILDNVETEKKKRTTTPRKKFAKPTLVEMTTYGIEYSTQEKVEMPDDWAKQLYNHYESNGWKIGKNKTPMKDWKGAVRNAILRVKGKPKNGKGNGGGKIDKIKQANAGIQDVIVD
jgi:hypothetical protein